MSSKIQQQQQQQQQQQHDQHESQVLVYHHPCAFSHDRRTPLPSTTAKSRCLTGWSGHALKRRCWSDREEARRTQRKTNMVEQFGPKKHEVIVCVIFTGGAILLVARQLLFRTTSRMSPDIQATNPVNQAGKPKSPKGLIRQSLIHQAIDYISEPPSRFRGK